MGQSESLMFDIPSDLSDTKTEIDPTALVEDGAELGVGVKVGRFAFISKQAKIGDHCRIGQGAMIEHKTHLGARNVIYPYAAIGAAPQDLKFRGEETLLEIGEANSFRQYSNVAMGTEHGGGITRVGDRNLLMVNAHIGHDCLVGHQTVIANGVSLAGHVTVHDHAILGGHCAVHQFCRVGERTMIAGGAMVVNDVPPFCIVHGDRASIAGLNLVGLKRAGFDGDRLKNIKSIYRIVFRENLTLEQALEKIVSEIPEQADRDYFVTFLKDSERGICR